MGDQEPVPAPAPTLEPPAASDPAPEPPPGPPYQWPLSLVLAGLVISLGVVASDHFRRGSVLFAACVILGFFLRLLLSERDAGWLAVRSRGIDLACLGFLGLGLSIFALVVPPPS